MSWSQTPVAVWDMVSAALVAAGYTVTLMPTVGQDVATLLDKSLILDMDVRLLTRASDAVSTGIRETTMLVELRITHVWFKQACSLAEAVADMWDRESEIHAAMAVPAVARHSSHNGMDHIRSETPRQISPGMVSQTITYQAPITRGSA